MKQKLLLLLFITGTILTIAYTGIPYDEYQYGNYEICFSRDYTNNNERKALEIAENIDYSKYLNLPRFDDGWPNYIDKEVIDHYNELFFKAKSSDEKVDIEYKYFAKAEYYRKLKIEQKIDNSSITVNGIDLSNDFRIWLDSAIIVLFEGNNSRIVKNQEYGDAEYNFSEEFTNVYFIPMDLQYYAIWGLLAGYFVGTSQIIILDDKFNPKMIIVEPSAHVVS